MMNKTFFSDFKLVFSIANRFSTADRSSRSSITAKLTSLGICFGVMTLIVVMSVMNGFQMSFITAILEISSNHIQISDFSIEEESSLIKFCENEKSIAAFYPYYEAQTLLTHSIKKYVAVENENAKADEVEYEEKIVTTYEGGALIRGVPADLYQKDNGFSDELNIVQGDFNLANEGGIVIGNTLAYKLHLHVGDTVNLFVLSGGKDVELFSSDRIFVVKGIFSSGYSEINSSYCFINISDAEKYFGTEAKKTYGIKLKKYNEESHVISKINKAVKTEQASEMKIKSWKESNKSFFGTLRVEKNMLLLLVCLIFVVVAVNIFNGMRRLVFERQREIAILSVLGTRLKHIQYIFVLRGFFTGFIGAVFGIVFGLIISMNTDIVFNGFSRLLYLIQYGITYITNPQNLIFVQENSSYSLYASIPAVIFPSEVILISFFGVISPVIASYIASKNILKLTITEVLHNE